MNVEIRRIQVESYQQALRDDAAAYRLAQGDQDRFGGMRRAARIPRTIGALRRLMGAAAA
jgi:hypothetical protein